MAEEEKVTNGRNSRKSQSVKNKNSSFVKEPLVKTSAEDKVAEPTTARKFPPVDPSIVQLGTMDSAVDKEKDGDKKESSEEIPSSTKLKESEQSAPAEQNADTNVTAAPTAAPAEPVMEAPSESAKTEGAEPATSVSDSAESEVASEDKESGESAPDRTESSETESKEPSNETEAKEPTEGTSGKADTGQPQTSKPAAMDKSSDKSTTQSTGSSTALTTGKPETKDPYYIGIPLEKKINKRTQRKLWEEIEKRKPLIPKHVAMHIQKYAKPPFETWGCKYTGKGSCYGCR